MVRMKTLKVGEFRAPAGPPMCFFITFWCHMNLLLVCSLGIEASVQIEELRRGAETCRVSSAWQGHC